LRLDNSTVSGYIKSMKIKNIILIVIVLLFNIRPVFCDDDSWVAVERIAPETIEEYIAPFKFDKDVKFYKSSFFSFWFYNFGEKYYNKPNIDSLIESLQPLQVIRNNEENLKVWFEKGKVKFIQETSYFSEMYGNGGSFYSFLGDTIEACGWNGSDRLYVQNSPNGTDLRVSIYKNGNLSRYLYCCTYLCLRDTSLSNYKEYKINGIITYDYYPKTAQIKTVKQFYNYTDMEQDIYAKISLYDKDGNLFNSLYYYPEIQNFEGINKKYKSINICHLIRGTAFTLYPHNLLEQLGPAEKERKNNGCVITWERNDSLKYVSFGGILGEHKHFWIILPDTIEELYDPGYARTWYTNVYKTAAIFENDTLRTKISCLWESCDSTEIVFCYKGKRIATIETFEYYPDSDTSAVSYVYSNYNDLINGNWGYKKLWDRDGNLINREKLNY